MQYMNQQAETRPAVSITQQAIARTSIVLALLTLAALGLRLLLLGKHGFWDDEMIVAFVIRQPLAAIFRDVMVNDSHPPLYHMLLRLWTLALGGDLWTMRLFSAAIGAACVPATYMLGREATGERRAALLAAALMAVAPFQIFHSQQARMYPLLTLVVALVALLFARAWRRGGWWRWLLVAVCCTAGVYTHVYFWFSLLGLNVWPLAETWRARRIDWRHWAGAVLAQTTVVLLFLPFVSTMFGTVQAVVKNFWIKNNTAFDWLFNLVSLANNATALTDPYHPQVTLALFAAFFPALLAVLLALIYSLRRAWHNLEERSGWLLLHALIWTPIIVATAISLTLRPILLDRSLIGLSAPLFILMGWMLSLNWRSWPARGVALLYAASIAVMLARLYTAPPLHNDLLDVANQIAAERRPGDAVAYADWQMFDASALAQPTLPDVYALPPESGDTRSWLERMRVMHTPEPHRSEPVASFAPRYQRVWLVFTVFTAELDYHKRTNLAWLRAHGREAGTFETPRALVSLYELGPSSP
jgi:4-amino-4-deoxy-L-arabinose transferase-like glycosyltransferase